ncbi:DUF1810 domain-containing protein [Flavobacterium agricola]|uniref:DUF1810 domain-containing protein n=1 Tax=Flavobacterium agricola TaxID=2870839 RepID=A0ABY6LZK0_9FLAO|nr:DUF1810 domain-containing protein [Flavobacterium agricola]UYW01743.1 DUF1810 domain-containing protein [Flavobacterium agricola]
MTTQEKLDRFLKVQELTFDNALQEISLGKIESEWMWYIFPQMRGLGFSETSKYYGIDNYEQAQAYIEHEVLGPRLVEACEKVLEHKGKSIRNVFTYPDDSKLKSSMSLFCILPETHPIFQEVLDTFFDGKVDFNTITLLNETFVK